MALTPRRSDEPHTESMSCATSTTTIPNVYDDALTISWLAGQVVSSLFNSSVSCLRLTDTQD